MDGVIDIDHAREMVADAALWPRIRDFLWDFAPQIHPSRLDAAGLGGIDMKSGRLKAYVLGKLGVEPLFHTFPEEDFSRLALFDFATLDSISKWLGALSGAVKLRRVMDGAGVRALKAQLAGVYPEVFSYTAYFRELDGMGAGRMEALSSEELPSAVVSLGRDLLFSCMSDAPEGVMARLMLKFPIDVAPTAGDVSAPSGALIQKLLKFRFPEAFAICCS